MKNPTQKQAKKATLKLWKLLISEASNGCAARGVLPGECSGSGQACHILKKEMSAQKSTDVANGWWCCAGHHLAITHNEARWLALVHETCGVGFVARI